MMASLILFTWPIVVLMAFSRKKVEIALPFSVIAGYLLLPTATGIDLPLLPTLDKDTVPVLTACLILLFAGSIAVGQPHIKGLSLQNPWGNGMLILFLICPFLTVFVNPDPLFYGTRFVTGLAPYDAFSAVLTSIMLILPFALAYKFMAHPQHHRILLAALIVSALLYSILALYEIRMSPQLNKMVYGFFPNAWMQHVRGSGFRPLVFLEHGLHLSLFLSFSVLAAVGGRRFFPPQYRTKLLLAAALLFVVLVLSKSLGALLITLLLLPAAVFLRARTQLLIAGILAGCVLIYPLLRGADLVPTDRILNFAEQINTERANSLSIRFRNEDVLLEKARQRPLLGWGLSGRSRVYDETGRDIGITDGYWVIIFGVGGWLRYIAEMGLLTGPLILLALRARRDQIGAETAILALVLTANLLDLIPNAGMSPLTWLFAGALWGRLALGDITEDSTQAFQPDTDRMQRYARAPGLAVTDKKAPLYTRQRQIKYRR